MTWKDYGDEQILHDSAGQILARARKLGCCWYASLGMEPMTYGRYKTLHEAKAMAERLVNAQAVSSGH